MVNIVVIGGGNVAEAISLAICQSDELSLVQMYVRSAERAQQLRNMLPVEVVTSGDELCAADLYILAVSDSAIEPLSRELPFASGAVVVHTAGSVPLSTIEREGRLRGVIYPLQTFIRGRKVDFRAVPVFIEAEDQTTRALLNVVACALSDSVKELCGDDRCRLHIAAVWACNFANAMWGVAHSELSRVGLTFSDIRPLVEETLSKALAANSPLDVQTGPAARGDVTTQSRHLQLIESSEDGEIYKLISDLIWKTSKRS